MLRILLSGLLMLAVVAEASAQTTPTGSTATKTTARTKTTTSRPVKKAQRTTTTRKATVKRMGAANTTARPAARPVAETGGRNDIGPGGNGAVGSTESADGKGQSVYAAPGMPVNVSDPKKVSTYDNKPAGPVNRTSTGTAPR